MPKKVSEERQTIAISKKNVRFLQKEAKRLGISLRAIADMTFTTLAKPSNAHVWLDVLGRGYALKLSLQVHEPNEEGKVTHVEPDNTPRSS